MKRMKRAADYATHYNESELFRKIRKVSGNLGSSLLYYVLVLYFLIADKTIPVKVRMAFVAALGYFILPTDLITDFLPVIGYTDDMALLTFVIGNATNYITPGIQEKAQLMRDAILGINNSENNSLEEN